MSKYRVTECPGCGMPFREGRSMSQHLIWSPSCKQVATQLNITVPIFPGLHNTSPHPFLCALEQNPGIVRTRNDSFSDSSVASGMSGSLSFPNVDTADDPDIELPADDTLPSSDDNLQNAVAFPVAFSDAALHEVELLKLLHQIGAPNHAFESLMSWAQKAGKNGYHFQPTPKCYESQIRNLTGIVGMTPCRPSVSQVSLEPDDLVLDVVVFPFASMLASLLNCPMLNKLENLVVNPVDRYGRYCAADGLLGEVNSGQWYQDTYDRMVIDPDKDFLCPIIFAMDKTVISEISHLSVNVILFSTTIYNREVSASNNQDVEVLIYFLSSSHLSLLL